MSALEFYRKIKGDRHELHGPIRKAAVFNSRTAAKYIQLANDVKACNL